MPFDDDLGSNDSRGCLRIIYSDRVSRTSSHSPFASVRPTPAQSAFPCPLSVVFPKDKLRQIAPEVFVNKANGLFSFPSDPRLLKSGNVLVSGDLHGKR